MLIIVISCNLVAVCNVWRWGIFWKINLDQTVVIHNNNLNREGVGGGEHAVGYKKESHGVRFRMVSLEFFIDIILLAAL